MKKVFILVLCFFTMSVAYAQTVTIGNQVWTTKNLDVNKFRNGDIIPEAKTEEEWLKAGENKEPSWCYFDNDPANGKKYGKLYNWYALKDPRGLAPVGYHVPTDAEWKILTNYLGGLEVAGKKMKKNGGWEENDGNFNESGFSGLPGGFRSFSGSFVSIGDDGCWWSSTEGSSLNAWTRNLSYEEVGVSRNNDDKAYGLFVRCLKD